MKLIIKRDQDKGFFGGMSFILQQQVVLTPEEQALITKYKAQKEVLFSKGDRVYTINDLLNGVTQKVKDVAVLLENEETTKEACKSFKVLV